MDTISLHQFLTIFTWFALSALLFLLAMIARKYETLSGQNTYYQFFAIPIVAFAGAAIRQTYLDQVTGDVWADLFLLVGGGTLIGLCVHVYRLMTSG